MSRHSTRIAIALALVLACGADARAEVKLSIDILMSHTTAPYRQALEGFRRFLSEHGLIADLRIISLDATGEVPAQAARTEAARHPDATLALGSRATALALENGGGSPIVAGMVLNAEDFVWTAQSQGVTLEIPIETQLSTLRRILPDSRVVGIIYGRLQNQDVVDAAERAAATFGLKIEAIPIDAPPELPDALDRLAQRIDVLLVLPDKLVANANTSKQLILFSFRNRIPLVGPSQAWTEAGALYSLGWDFSDIGVQCGELIAAAVGKKNAAGARVVPSRTITYSLNLRSAQQLDVEIPDGVRREAHAVFP